MFQFLRFHGVFTCEIIYLSCFVIKQKIFTSFLKIYKVELWYNFLFTKAKVYPKVFIFGSKSYKLKTNGKYNISKKIKSVVNICVGNELDMWFWWFTGKDSVIFLKIKLECYLEYLIAFFCCGRLSMGVWWEDKWRWLIMIFCQIFVCQPDLVCW